MSKKDYANYNVAFKILLKKGADFLFLKGTKVDKLDLPGGRIDEDEHYKGIGEILDREIKEELGSKLKYKLNNPIIQFRRHFDGENRHIFITVFAADYLEGEIEISDEHSDYIWVNPKSFDFNKELFFSQEEFEAVSSYLSSL